MNILITGHSRGLGAALARYYLARGHALYGVARGSYPHLAADLREVTCDLRRLDTIVPALDRLCAPAVALDLVYLNAAMFGRIDHLRATALADLQAVMDVNLWANKLALDWLAARVRPPAQIILLSSGAAVVGNRGWGSYALSKATLNMLTQLYAQEMPHSHLVALAPGLVDTEMQAALRKVDASAFPSLLRLRRAHGSAAMPGADAAAMRIAAKIPDLITAVASGSYVDLRTLS